ncbi:MAG: hypothetical protein ACYTGG_09710 [Planctomycetota bacterium]
MSRRTEPTPVDSTTRSAPRARRLQIAGTVIAAILFGGSALYLALGADKGLGILLVIVSALLARVIILGPGQPGRGRGPTSPPRA